MRISSLLGRKVLAAFAAALALVVLSCGGAGSGAKKTAEKVTIKVWDWDEAYLKEMIPEFNKAYPDITVEYAVVNPNDYLQKLQSGIASGSEVPDVILGESAYRGKLFDLGVLDDLEKAPYGFKRSELLDYLVPLMSDPSGAIVGVDQQITPAGLAYRRDLAKKYWGTDDPAELEKLLGDWDSFIAKGVEVKEKSGGKVVMFAGLGDAFIVLRGQSSADYVSGNEIDLSSRFLPSIKLLFRMRDAGILGKHELWTPSWATSMATGECVFYPMAPWGPKWHISANDKEGSGRWGLVMAPGGSFTRGGTSVSVYKDSKVKEAAWAYVNFCYLSDEGTKAAYAKFGFTPGVKAFYEKNADLIAAGSEYDAFFGGQNIIKYFIEKIVPGVKGEKQTKYDSVLDGTLMTLYPLWTKDTAMDADAAFDLLSDGVRQKAPKAIVK